MHSLDIVHPRWRSAPVEIAMCLAFIAALVASTISGYHLSSFLIKGIVTLVASLLYFLDFRFGNPLIINGKSHKKFITAALGLLLVPSATIFYSISPGFGLKKILNLLISTVPAVIFLYYLLISLTPLRVRVFRALIIILSLSAVGFSIIFSPFQFRAYQFGLFNWSHVIFGRFVGAGALISFIIFSNSVDRKKSWIFLTISLVLFSGVIYSGLRASIIGLPLFALIYAAYLLVKRKMNRNTKLALFVFILAVSVSAYLVFNFNQSVMNRVTDLGTAAGWNKDGPIISRLAAYKISLNIFLNNPIVGLGIGGFRNPVNGGITLWMNYPHNIILEVMAEYGTVGLIVFLYLAWLVLSKSFKISCESLIYFSFMLWLAMYSKDLTTNTLFLSGIAITGITINKTGEKLVSSFWRWV